MSEEMRQNFLKELDKCIEDWDTEMAHVAADEILCRVLVLLGYQDIADKWEQVSKWYS